MKRFFDKSPIIVYIIILAVLVGNVVFLGIRSAGGSEGNKFGEGVIGLNDGWTLEDGTPIDNIEALNALPDASKDKERSIYNVLPDEIPKGGVIAFHIKHTFFSVFIDGQEVYNKAYPESRLYTNSLGSVWAMVPVNSEDAGKTVEFRYRICYEDSECGIEQAEVCVGHNAIQDIINKKCLTFIISLIYMTVSIILIVLDYHISRKLNHTHSFLYLGLITFSVALFSLTETQLVQLFINGRLVHLMTCSALIMGSMPVVMYADSVFSFRYKYTVHLFAASNIIIYAFMFILNFTDTADYHDMLFLVHINIIASIAAMVSAIIRYIIRKFNETGHFSRGLIAEIFGFSTLMLTGIIDVCRYYIFNTDDPAKFVRIGLLLFIVLFAVSTCNKLIDMLVLNERTEFIAKLAYQDGLTGLYNRTAYNEKLEELHKLENNIGICAFDVNDLKKINDNMGHDMGDKLIQESSRIISEAFEPSDGICYRIGGDEFMVIVYGINTGERIETSLNKLSELCGDFNSAGKYPFKISIAAGSCIYDGSESIDTVIKKADQIMYENKRKMKAEKNDLPR